MRAVFRISASLEQTLPTTNSACVNAVSSSGSDGRMAGLQHEN